MHDDLKAAVRSLNSSKTFTVVALVVLTLGIGASTAVFSVVDAVVLRGLPFDEHDRLVAVGERYAGPNRAIDPNRDPDGLSAVAPQNYLDWTAQQRVFESIAAMGSGWLTLRAPDAPPESLIPRRVTADFFKVLRVAPALGRTFAAENEVAGRDRVVLLSDGLWRRRFGADPGIIGRAIPLEDLEGGRAAADTGGYEVIGVMPPGFGYPVGASRSTDVWIPYVVPDDQRVRDPARRSSYLQVIARLAPGVSLAQAHAQMDQVGIAIEQANPVWNKDTRVGVRPLVDHLVGARVRSWMLMLLGAVGLVLLIACANVASLLLARASARERDIAVRAAIGASRWRLVRQLIVESLTLSIAGTACAIVMAWWAVGVLRAALPESLPRVATIALDLRVLAAAAALSLVTGLLFGIVPALQLSRPDLLQSLKDGGRSGVGAGRQRLRSALVVSEVALAVILLRRRGRACRATIQLRINGPLHIMQPGGCVMKLTDLTRIDRAIDIRVPPERVWRALTSADELSAWFQVQIEGDLAAGNEVWMTSVHPEHVGQRFAVRIVELTPHRRVVWRWHPGTIDPAIDYAREPQTTVTFTLEPVAGGTRLSVSETGFDAIALARRAKAYEDNSQGWSEVLIWLQRYVEEAR